MERQENIEYFLQKFSGMNPTQREDWITRFRHGAYTYVPRSTAAVYCGMWNGNFEALEGTIRSYKDFISNLADEDLEMSEIQVRVDDLYLKPNTKFSITWNVKNTGEDQWPPATHLALYTGFDGFPNRDCAQIVPRLLPGQNAFLQVEMVSLDKPGYHTAKWRLIGPSGEPISDDPQSVTVVIDIDDSADALWKQFADSKLSG